MCSSYTSAAMSLWSYWSVSSDILMFRLVLHKAKELTPVQSLRALQWPSFQRLALMCKYSGEPPAGKTVRRL